MNSNRTNISQNLLIIELQYNYFFDSMQQADEKVNENQNYAEIEAERGDYHNLVDILFVLDTTGSMNWCISQCKKTIRKIIRKFSEKQYNIKFAFELYRDHPPQEYSYIEKHFDLRGEQDALQTIQNQCQVSGGGDLPEAVIDGLYHGLKKTKWRIGNDGKTTSKRFLFHGCDAPPHGKQYGGQSSDTVWVQKGCPCGITRQQIKDLINQYNVDYSLIKCGKQVDLMESLFKEAFGKHFKRVIDIKKESQKKQKKKKKAQSIEIQQQQPLYVPSEILYSCEADIDSSHLKVLSYKISAQEQLFQDQCLPELKAYKMSFQDEAPKDELEYPKVSMKKRRKVSNSSVQQSGSESGALNRSMASLVCSEVQSGIQDFFDVDKKQEIILQKHVEQIKKQQQISEKQKEQCSQPLNPQTRAESQMTKAKEECENEKKQKKEETLL